MCLHDSVEQEPCHLFLIHAYSLYGVAEISRLLKITGLFCKRSLQTRPTFSKKTYNLKEPTNRSHPICPICLSHVLISAIFFSVSSRFCHEENGICLLLQMCLHKFGSTFRLHHHGLNRRGNVRCLNSHISSYIIC